MPIQKTGKKCEIPVTLILGHVFIEWKKRNECYKQAKLSRLNIHFFHPAADRLFALVKKAKPEECGGDLHNTIK